MKLPELCGLTILSWEMMIMYNIQLGLTPRYNINEQLSINLNYATFLLPIQHHYFDLAHDRSRATDLGIIHNVSVGIQYRIPGASKSMYR